MTLKYCFLGIVTVSLLLTLRRARKLSECLLLIGWFIVLHIEFEYSFCLQGVWRVQLAYKSAGCSLQGAGWSLPTRVWPGPSLNICSRHGHGKFKISQTASQVLCEKTQHLNINECTSMRWMLVLKLVRIIFKMFSNKIL